MKKLAILSLFSLFISTFLVFNTSYTKDYINQLSAAQPSIEELLAQLKSLQAQLAAKQAQVTTTYQFTRVLKVGDRGEDIRQLQILLNKDTLTQIAVSGDGSPGKETTYFGPATSRAVTKFQEKYKSEILIPNQLTRGTGTVGNATLMKLNALIAVTKTTGTPGNVAVITNNPNVVNNLPTQTSNSSTTTQTTTSTSSSLLPPTNCGAPVITSASSANGTVGSLFSYSISITSIAAPTFSASGLPSGLSLSGSKIIGTPTTAGTFTMTITATSNCGTGSKTVVITISPAVTAAQTCSSISQYGITWTFDKAYPCGQFVNSDWWVLGPVLITRITPDAANGSNGWMVNPSTDNVQAYDSRNIFYNAAAMPALPYNAPINSSIIKSTVNTSGICNYNSKEVCYLDTAAVLTVLGSVPANNGATFFRPPYFGTTKPLYSVNSINFNVLPNLSPTGNPPTLATVQDEFQRVQLDYNGAYNRSIHPQQNIPNYGAEIGSRDAEAALRLMLNDSTANKTAATINYIQYGIDLYHMLINGEKWTSNGGQGNGRKLPIAFAGTLLNNQAMINAVANASADSFGENGDVYVGSGSGKVLYGGGNCSEQDYWHKVAFPNGDGSNDCRDPYGYIDGGPQPGTDYQACCTSQVHKGTVLAVTLMSALQTAWNDTNLSTYVKRWVTTGVQSQPDVCAPYDGNWANYGVTFGPDGRGSCIKDTNTADGIGRFPNLQGTLADTGGYGSNFVNAMWTAYMPGLCYPPKISGTLSLLTAQNTPFSYTISSTQPGTYSVGTLPAGLIFSGSMISGTPTVSGKFTIPLTVTSSCGSDTNSLVLTISSTGLVGQWTFDSSDISGTTIADSSGNSTSGTLINGPQSITGKIGQALQFNGSNQYVDLGIPSNTTMGITNQMTVSAWVKLSSLSLFYNAIISKGEINTGASGQVYNMTLGTTAPRPQVSFSDGSNVVSAGMNNDYSYNTNTWYLFTGVLNGTTATLYINGVQVATGSNASFTQLQNPLNASGAMAIGASKYGGGNINAAIDDVRIYNRALSAAEVQQLYNGTLAYKTNQNFTASVWNGFMGIMTGIGSSILGILKLI